MDNEQLYDVAVNLSLALAVPLLVFSLMAVGKHAADLQYQRAAGLNGIRWLQSWTNLRTHGNRVFFAAAFLTTSLMGFFDIDIFTRTWVGRIIFLFVLLMYLLSSILDWFSERKQLQILLKYEEVNNIPVIRVNLHKLISLLTVLFSFTDPDMPTKANEHEIELIKRDIKTTVEAIQRDVRAMDPSYTITESNTTTVKTTTTTTLPDPYERIP